MVARLTGALTNNDIPRKAAAGLVASALTDDGTTVASSRRVAITGTDPAVDPAAGTITAGGGVLRAAGRAHVRGITSLLAGANIILDSGAASNARMELLYNGVRQGLINVDSAEVRIEGDNVTSTAVVIRTGTLNRLAVSSAGVTSITGTDPGTDPAAGTITAGGGVLRAAGQIRSYSTAVDSIQTAGGIRAPSPNTNDAELVVFSHTRAPDRSAEIAATVGDNTGKAGWSIRGAYGNNAGAAGFDLGLGSTGGRIFRIWTGSTGVVRAIYDMDGVYNHENATTPAATTAAQVNIGNGILDYGTSIRYRGTQILGAQGAAVADATDAATVIARLNDLLARCRAHGLIAT